MITNLNLTAKQSELFINSIKSLDELAMEMAIVSDKTGDIAVALAEWSESISKLHSYLTTPQEYVDTHLKTGKWMRNLLSDKPNNQFELNIADGRFELRKYVVVKCESTTSKSVSFTHVGAHEPVLRKNKNFKDDITAEFFKAGSYYVVYCTELRNRVYCWHWAHEVDFTKAQFINANLKAVVKQLLSEGGN